MDLIKAYAKFSNKKNKTYLHTTGIWLQAGGDGSAIKG